MLRLVLVATALASAGSVPLAHAQSSVGLDWEGINESAFLADGPNGTAISGYSSGMAGDVYLEPNSYLLTIGGKERGDAPCQMSFRLRGPDGLSRYLEHEICTGRPRSPEQTEISQRGIDPPERDRWAVAGIEVCTNARTNQRLKGVRISTVRLIGEDGVTDVPKSVWGPNIRGKFQRANCSRWQPEARCAAGMIAWGARVYHDEDGISGLSLICAPARYYPPDEAPVVVNPYGLGDPTGRTTRVSGSAATPTVIWSDEPGEFALTRIAWGERRDRPCVFEVGFKHVRAPRIDSPGGDLSAPEHDVEKSLEECGRDRDVQYSVRTSLSGQFAVDNAGENYGTYLHAIRACMNRGGDRIKGLEVGTSVVLIGPDGAPSIERPPAGVGMIDEASNCGDRWQRWASCASGELAVGLVVHLESGDAPRAASGVALECAPLEASAPLSRSRRTSVRR